jgi:hypothetical protein
MSSSSVAQKVRARPPARPLLTPCSMTAAVCPFPLPPSAADPVQSRISSSKRASAVSPRSSAHPSQWRRRWPRRRRLRRSLPKCVPRRPTHPAHTPQDARGPLPSLPASAWALPTPTATAHSIPHACPAPALFHNSSRLLHRFPARPAFFRSFRVLGPPRRHCPLRFPVHKPFIQDVCQAVRLSTCP